MKAYAIYCLDERGYKSNRIYRLKYSAALQEFNNTLRQSIKEVYEPIAKDDFSQQVANFRKYYTCQPGIELTCRKCPFILYRHKNKLIAKIYSWNEVNYEDGEQDIISENVILEEIQIK